MRWTQNRSLRDGISHHCCTFLHETQKKHISYNAKEKKCKVRFLMQPRVVVMRLVILLTSLPFVVGDEGKCWEGHYRSRGRLKDSMESCKKCTYC